MPHYPNRLYRRLGRPGAALTAAVCVGLAPAGCTAGDPPRPPVAAVTIGLLADQTSTDLGPDAVRGAELAAEVVNTAYPDLALPLAGGAGLPSLDGAALRLVVADSGGTPDTALVAIGELITGPVVAVVAADQVTGVEIASRYADRRQVPMVDGASTATHLLDLGLSWYFRTGPSDRMLTEAGLALLPPPEQPDQAHRVAVLAPGDRSGIALAGLLAEQVGAAGLALAGTHTPDGSLASTLAASAPEVLLAAAPTTADGPVLHAGLADLGEPGPLVIGLGPGFAAGSEAGIRPGVVHATAWSADLAGRHPAAQAVASLYQSRYEAPMTEPAALAFTATLTVAMAIDAAASQEAAGEASVSPAAIRAALRRLSVPATQTIMPWNGIRFGDTGQNELAAGVLEQHGPDGARLVYPPELAVTDLAWP